MRPLEACKERTGKKQKSRDTIFKEPAREKPSSQEAEKVQERIVLGKPQGSSEWVHNFLERQF